MKPNYELVADARSIREAMRRTVSYASDATERLDKWIEAETMDGTTEAGELREALERVQPLSLEVSENLDAYQNRHALFVRVPRGRILGNGQQNGKKRHMWAEESLVLHRCPGVQGLALG